MRAPTSPTATIALLAIGFSAAAGCIFHSTEPREVCADAGACHSRYSVTGPVHGLRADKRVDVSAKDAWPGRSPEPAFPSGDDLLRGCVSIASCLSVPDLRAALRSTGSLATSDDAFRADFIAACARPPSLGEENAVLMPGTNERLTYLVSVAIAAKADCAKIQQAHTTSPAGLVCESHGCEWSSKDELVPTVTCNGSVATLTTNKATYTRDCAHAFTTCDATSATGCADRPLVKCDPAGKDRCDGNTHLGCRLIGFVSMRDCARLGGTCKETGAETADCDYGPACAVPGGATCDGAKVKSCSLGKEVSVDCVALGFGGCAGGHCK